MATSTGSSPSTEELLRRLDEQHQAYLKTFRLVHEALAQSTQQLQHQQHQNSQGGAHPSSPIITATNGGGLSVPIPISPGPHISLALPSSPPSRTPSRRRRTSTEGEFDRPLRRPGTFQSSVFTGDSDESDTDADLYVQDALPSYTFDLEDLRLHLKTYKFEEAGQTLLKSVVKNGRLKHPGLFHEYPEGEKWHNSHYSVFDVDRDGAPLSRWEVVKPGTTSIDSAIWQVIKDLNSDPEARTASGRITIIREPSPLILGALHLTMKQDFDMDEVFDLLFQQTHTTVEMTNRAFHDDHRQQRSFVFNFDYYTVVGEETAPMPWQRTDRPEKLKNKFHKHIQISRCSSVVALSLSGNYVKKLKSAARSSKNKDGYVYDPWAAWHVLNIQCYPDHKHSMDSHDSTKHYVNGPEAFMHTLLAELKDAEKRFKEINARITELVTPEADFMFDGKLRDKLLFEDPDFTYSRRYFWAYQTLGIMMNSIRAILDACHQTFTDEFWEGKHRSLWPMLEQDSARNVYWRKRMAGLKRDFDRQQKNLMKVFEENDDRRKEIRTLRDQLFSGTSVLESRKSVELSEVTILQGHNIKLLTLVSIFFLPLTFVTSVFGMSNMPTEHEFNVFGIVMTTVCVPFFFLIGSLNTTQGMRFWRSKYHQFLQWCFGKKKAKTDDEDEEKPLDEDSDSEKELPSEPMRKHKRTHSTNIALEKRQNQIKPFPISRPPTASAKASGLESPHASLTLHSRSNSDFVIKIEGASDLPTREDRKTSGVAPIELRPVIVEVLPPKEEVDYGNRRIEGAEKRVIDLGLGMRDVQATSGQHHQGQVVVRERGRSSVSVEGVRESSETMWWGKMVGKTKGSGSGEV